MEMSFIRMLEFLDFAAGLKLVKTKISLSYQ